MGFMDMRLAPWMTSVYGFLTAGSSVIRRRRTVIEHTEPDSAIALVSFEIFRGEVKFGRVDARTCDVPAAS
jgi:hypothetical protein